MSRGLQGQVALVTGGNAGIGAAIARALSARGAAVAIHYLEAQEEPAGGITFEHNAPGEEAAIRLQEEIRSQGGRTAIVPGDLSDPAVIPQLLDRVVDLLGPPTILVNNAAHCELPDTIAESSAGSIDRHFQVNVRAAVLLVKEFADRIDASDAGSGRVINISTDAAQSFATQISYGASKAALEAYTRSIAIELAPRGITVNAIAPGPVQTGWMDSELESHVADQIPLGRVGRPEDIAHAVVFFASEEADWITGQVLRVAGGNVL